MNQDKITIYVIVFLILLFVLIFTFKGTDTVVDIIDGSTSYLEWSFWGLKKDWYPMRSRGDHWEIKYKNGTWETMVEAPDIPYGD